MPHRFVVAIRATLLAARGAPRMEQTLSAAPLCKRHPWSYYLRHRAEDGIETRMPCSLRHPRFERIVPRSYRPPRPRRACRDLEWYVDSHHEPRWRVG